MNASRLALGVIVLAEALPDALSGNAGWASFGLAGLILFWLLLKHLPEKDRQLKDLLEGKDKQLASKDEQIVDLIETRDNLVKELTANVAAAIKELSAGAAATAREQRAEHREAVDAIFEHCKREMATLSEGLHKDMGLLTVALQDLRVALDFIRRTEENNALHLERLHERLSGTTGGKQ